MSTLLIRNGRLIDPANNIDAERDLLLRDGRVAAVEPAGVLDDYEVAESIDAAGMIVAPGLIDMHVHLREPGQSYKETIASGTAAAAVGGFTSVVAMPNTVPVNGSAATLEWMLDAARGARVKLFAMAAATKDSQGTELTDFAALRRAGAVGFTDDGKPVLEERIMRAALIAAARAGVPLSQHAEDTRISAGGCMNAGAVAFRLGLRGIPVAAESLIVERDIQLLREIETSEGLHPHLHVQHVSTARALETIRAAKQEGLHVTCEVTPHHFTLTDEAVGDYDTHAKMSPPLRAEADRLALIAGLVDGTVDCIATDHAPHAAYEKEVEFDRAANGITGLETALGLALGVLHQQHGLSLGRVVELMSAGPASILALSGRGSLGLGHVADVVLFDVDARWQFKAADSLSRSRNTPFDGATMVGRISATLCEGRIIYRDSPHLQEK
ncbi:MAG: dihydroorotase [Acidobacteriaceae bacterium]|nr:dihydroorotase [Acidobacteriaceae bacterium]